MILILGPCLVRQERHPGGPLARVDPLAGSFFRPKCPTRTGREPGMSDQTSCVHRASRSKVSAPKVQHAVLQDPWIAGICPQAKEASSSILSIQPGVHPAGGDESDEWHGTKSAAPAPHDIVQPGKLGRTAAPWAGVWGELRAFTWPAMACTDVYNLQRLLRL